MEQQKQNQQQPNEGITNYNVLIGHCAECGAEVYAPHIWKGVGERPVTRFCRHTGAILPLHGKAQEPGNLFKQTGW